MGEVVPARTSPTLHPPSPPTVHQLSRLALYGLRTLRIGTTRSTVKYEHQSHVVTVDVSSVMYKSHDACRYFKNNCEYQIFTVATVLVMSNADSMQTSGIHWLKHHCALCAEKDFELETSG